MRILRVLMIMVVFWSYASVVKSESIAPAGIPATGAYTTEELTLSGEFKIGVQGNKIIVNIPMPNLAKTDLDKITIFASFAWTDGKTWYLVSSDDYSKLISELGMAEDGSKKVSIQLPDKGNGWFWFRIWGQNNLDRSWLWIKENNPYVRLDTKDNPGYEVIVNRTGESQPVPKEYDKRQ